jgi:hypothetical protein
MAGGINLYEYVGGDPVNYVDVNGLWSIYAPWTWGDPTPAGHSPWSWNNPQNNWGDIKSSDFRDGAFATLDGIIPIIDPFSGFYDKCLLGAAESSLIASYSRDIGFAAFVPNLAAWAKNPILYEIGQLTVTSKTYAAYSHLEPAARGAAMVKELGYTGIAKEMVKAIGSGSWGKTWATGGTPAARLVGIWAFGTVDRNIGGIVAWGQSMKSRYF